MHARHEAAEADADDMAMQSLAARCSRSKRSSSPLARYGLSRRSSRRGGRPALVGVDRPADATEWLKPAEERPVALCARVIGGESPLAEGAAISVS